MPDQAKVDQLRAVPMLSQLPFDALERLADLASEFEVSTGHVLIQQDQPGTEEGRDTGETVEGGQVEEHQLDHRGDDQYTPPARVAGWRAAPARAAPGPGPSTTP